MHVCIGTIYTFLAIPYISLFYRRILRTGCSIRNLAFSSRNPSQMKYARAILKKHSYSTL